MGASTLVFKPQFATCERFEQGLGPLGATEGGKVSGPENDLGPHQQRERHRSQRLLASEHIPRVRRKFSACLSEG